MKSKTKEFWIKSAGKKVYCDLEVPDNPKDSIIILLHGLTNSHTDCPLIHETTEALLRIGYPVFRFDYFGSGKSDGVFKDKTWDILIQNTKDSVHYVASGLGYSKIGLWGRSLGAILGATVSDDPSVAASVFLSMTMQTKISFSTLFPPDQPFSLPIHGTAKVKGEPILNRQFYLETPSIDTLQQRHLSNANNVLIIQGTRDKTVNNPAWAKDIYNLVNKPKDLIYVKGADHAYRGYEAFVVNKTTAWYESFTKNT